MKKTENKLKRGRGRRTFEDVKRSHEFPSDTRFRFWQKMQNVSLSVNEWPTSIKLSSGCGSVGIAVASDIRGPRFESTQRQSFKYNICLLATVLKYENKRKEAEKGLY